MTGPHARAEEREAMLRAIAADAWETRRWTGRDAFSDRVMEALRRVPRHAFVPETEAYRAYRNQALPIGHGQTISQPYVVALMTELAELTPESVVLEVGVGSGYQAAVLAELADRVYGIELEPELAAAAARCLARLGYDRVEVRAGDGFAGWPEHAPYDAILVTAAAGEAPPPLLAQLAPGGRLVIPLESRGSAQELTVLTRDAAGAIGRQPILPVAFVPFRRALPGSGIGMRLAQPEAPEAPQQQPGASASDARRERQGG